MSATSYWSVCGRKRDREMIKYLIIYIALSAMGWFWLFMGISSLHDYRRVKEQERARATARIIDMVAEKKQRRNRRRHMRETYTVWHPVLEFAVEGRVYRLQSAACLTRDELTIGQDVDICYDADDPSHFHFEKRWESVTLNAKISIAIGLIWVLAFSPFMINRFCHF